IQSLFVKINLSANPFPVFRKLVYMSLDAVARIYEMTFGAFCSRSGEKIDLLWPGSITPAAKLHPKTAPFPHLGFNADAASHLFGDLSDNGQANARSFVIGVEPLKHAKEAVARAVGYANAIVLNPDADGERIGKPE